MPACGSCSCRQRLRRCPQWGPYWLLHQRPDATSADRFQVDSDDDLTAGRPWAADGFVVAPFLVPDEYVFHVPGGFEMQEHDWSAFFTAVQVADLRAGEAAVRLQRDPRFGRAPAGALP